MRKSFICPPCLAVFFAYNYIVMQIFYFVNICVIIFTLQNDTIKETIVGLKNEKSETQGARRNEGHFSNSEGDFYSSTRINESSNQPWLESVRPVGENWTGGNKIKRFVSTTVGKLIDRLIQSWTDRKKEALDCLTRYNDQINKCNEEIGLLELIKAELADTLDSEE